MDKRSLSVDKITIKFFNESLGFIEEFIVEYGSNGTSTIISDDEISEAALDALCKAESELGI